MEQYRKQLNMD